jgi:hypothetical protein
MFGHEALDRCGRAGRLRADRVLPGGIKENLNPLLIWPTRCGVARCKATKCHIYNVAYNILGLSNFVLIEFDVVAALQNQQLLRKTRALLVRRGEGNVSCRCRAAVRRAGRYREGVGTNLRNPRRSAAARPKGSDANCQSKGEHCSHGCDHPVQAHPTRFCAVLSGNLHRASLELIVKAPQQLEQGILLRCLCQAKAR